MIFKKKKAKKIKDLQLTDAEKRRVERLNREYKPTTQNTLRYATLYENEASLFETGLMHVAKNIYSQSISLQDINYMSAQIEDQLKVVKRLEQGVSALHEDNQFHLLIHNKPVGTDRMENALLPVTSDMTEIAREIALEYNDMIVSRNQTKIGFEVNKYVTITTQADDPVQAQKQLTDTLNSYSRSLRQAKVKSTKMDGSQRMQALSEVLRPESFANYSLKDLQMTGKTTKDFVAPRNINFEKKYFEIDDKFGAVYTLRDYPTHLGDHLFKDLLDVGSEMYIALLANPFGTDEVLKKIRSKRGTIETDEIKQIRQGNKDFLPTELSVSKKTAEGKSAADDWEREVTKSDQKIFSAGIYILFIADSLDELELVAKKAKSAVSKNRLTLEVLYSHQEEGLNTILPIGVNFLGNDQQFVRNFTARNVATQVPFTNVDLQSSSLNARYYGQNQETNNMITVDRQTDVNAPTGMALGTTGSGKSFSIKSNEIIPTRLKFPNDKIVIVDPEGEYVDICREFNGQVIDVHPGASTKLNIMEKVDDSLLTDVGDKDYIDPISQKASLLTGVFSRILGDVDSIEFALIDRVTHLVYEKFSDPTLVDWSNLMKAQVEPEAQTLATKLEPFISGSKNIFSEHSNVDMSNNFIVFNLKGIGSDAVLKSFAMLVIQDFMWNMIVEGKKKQTTWFYYDEIQIHFENDYTASYFSNTWARIRKYGANPLGITQLPMTVLSNKYGYAMFKNTEFFILLKIESDDLQQISDALGISESLGEYCADPTDRGTGLIVAGKTIVPFENPIPKNTRLYELCQTDPS